MGFRASTITQEEAWNKLRSSSLFIESQGEQISAESAAGPIRRTEVLDYAFKLRRAVNNWVVWAAVPGLQDYVRDQIRTPAADIEGEYRAMLSAANAMLSWLDNNLPAGGYSTRAGGEFTLTPTTFTTADLNQFRNNITALNATID